MTDNQTRTKPTEDSIDRLLEHQIASLKEKNIRDYMYPAVLQLTNSIQPAIENSRLLQLALFLGAFISRNNTKQSTK